MSDNTIRKKGVWMPPAREGKIIVNVVCAEGGGRIGYVRVVRGRGPVLRWRGGIDIETADLRHPNESLDLQYEPGRELELWCPLCGLHPLDYAALRAVAKKAAWSPTPLKLSV